jgi:hypothetical protein
VATEICSNQWDLKDVTTGWLMTEGCVRCGAKRSFFSQENRPPLDSYIEGDHYWRDFEGTRAVRFNLLSSKTGGTFKLDNFLGLAFCQGCNSSCLAGSLNKLLKPDRVWVYLALCADPSHVSGKCVSTEQTVALTDYFNSRLSGTGKRVLIMPCIFRKEPDCCRGQIIAELGGMDVA